MPIGAVASLGSAAIGAGGSLLAANTQADAQKQALALQQKEFNTGRADLAPYRDVGQNALYTLAGFYGLPTPNSPGGPGAIQNALQNFTQTPDYQFAFQQGERALNNSLAARGLGVSGAGIKGAQEFGQGLASQQFTNYWNKLQGLAGMG